MSKNKVKAFTVMELVITMLVAAILMGFIYTAFQIINNSYRAFHQKNEGIATLERLDELLKKDFGKAEFIEKTSDGIILKRKTDTVRYTFSPGYILRISSIVDTLKLKNADVSTLFGQLPVDGQGLSEEDNRIDELDVSLLIENEKVTYQYHKEYSSANLINRQTDAIN
ncbi:PulJ/GspJ family protein [Mucilaginibacter sp. McL0603]|uniref:PulJ/GspJ family protein n=1 Tax=Mucilaginibacter sp. McL0603 TaxID=3415670 RepID=UPI003CF29953